MKYTHNSYGGTYELTNEADESGMAQFIDLATNHTVLGLMKDFTAVGESELERKIARHREQLAELSRAYKEGLGL